MTSSIIEQVRTAAAKRILFLPHAIRQMCRVDRIITTTEIERIVKTTDELVEDYPEDVRGHSCLLLGLGDDESPIPIVCAPKDDYLAIITVYIPDPTKWSPDFKRRL